MDGRDRWERLDRLFERACALPTAERAAFLERECGADDGLRSQLASLLEHAPQHELELVGLAGHISGRVPESRARSRVDPLIGRMVHRYRIQARLGGGGMGVVYRAWDAALERAVALKFISPALSVDEAARRRFLTEARAAAAIDHPNICAVHEVGEAEDGTPFLAMTYYEGETLRDRIARGPLAISDAVDCITQIARGVGAAHVRGVLHRDIKPGNILITVDGVAKLLDFGVAKRTDSAVTRSGGVAGTAAYMSPEQLRGERVDARTDVWSLGVVLYESLAGRAPFRGDTEAETIRSILFEEPPPLRYWRPDLPERLASATDHALAKEREARYATVDELILALHTPVGRDAVGVLQMPPLSAAHAGPDVGKRPTIAARPSTRTIALALLLVLLLPAGLAVRAWQTSAGGGGAPLLVVAARADPLAAESARELARRLNRWDPAPAAIRGPPAADADGRSPLDQTLTLAGSAGASELVVVDAAARDASVRVAVDVYDVASQRPLRSITATVAPGDWSALDGIAYTLLGLDADPLELSRLQRESRRTAAVRAQLEGRGHLERLELRQAEARFRAALTEDSTFSAAHHGLALALYWSAARSWNPNRFGASERVGRATAAAVRHARHMAPDETEHYRAFDAFQRGDYETARTLYHRRIARDSSDAHAWLGLGMIEAADPWALQRSDGTLRPRADRGLALRAFREAMRRKPGFFLGYGHLFDVYLDLAGWIAHGGCPGFERPRAEQVLPWETRTATQQVFFCPDVAADSVVWSSWDAWPLRDRTRAAAVADALMETVRREALRWQVSAPETPGPHEAWASWWLARRAGVPQPIDRVRADSFAAEALAATVRATALRRDTTADDLIRIGSLQLAMGNTTAALSTTRRATAAGAATAEAWLVPIAAANTFLAAGDGEQAAAILRANWSRWFSFAVHDTVERRSLHVRDAPALLARIHALSAVGATGPQLRREFEALEQTWAAHGLTRRQTALLRMWATRFVTPALALDDQVRRAWFADWDSVPPLWRAFDEVEADPGAASRVLDAQVARIGSADRPHSLFPAALLAQRSGRHALALALFERMDEAVLDVENVDTGWGLRALSLLLRARSYEHLGATARATAAYRAFLELRHDAPASPWSDEASASLARLERGEAS